MASRLVCCLHVWSLVFSVLFINFRNAVSDDDFYGILGVSRNANSDSIRRAYRRLAKEWHPDKNTDSNAQEKFIKINEAYETLSDPKKRENYDRYGQAQAPSDWEQEHDFFHDSGFMFFNDMPFQFQSNWQHRDFTTSNFYKKTILPDSFKKPYLLQIVSDWCLNCAAVEEIWEAASRDLKSLGVGIGCVNRNIDPQLAKDLGARKLPDFVGIINGKLYHFTGAVTVEKLKNFVSGLFPKDLVPEVTNSTLNQFLHHWYDNKPRALLFTTKSEAPLLLKIVSFKYRAFVGIGYLQLAKPHNGETRVKFGAAKNEPSFAVFKEDTSRPQILLKGSELKTGTLDEVISMNLYLDFPRISSKAMLETTCPQGKFVSERSLCVILFIDNIKEIENGHPLLTMSKDRAWLLKRIRFGYVNQKVQHDFASSIKMSEKTRTFCKDNKLSRKVAVLWHLKDREVKYSWLENGWCEPQDVSRLAAMLNWIHSGKVEFEMSAVVAELVNEHGKSFGPWLLDLWDDVVYYSLHYVNWSGNLPALSLIITFTFVFMVSCLFPVVSENESTLKNNGQHQRPNRANVFGLVQLNSQTQNELIHKAKQGRLVVVLLSDATSESEAVRSPIVQTFAGITRYYLRENIFTFGWLSIQDNIAWCNEVMKVQTFGEVKPGTVLALNGAKKYLSIFKVQRQNQDDFRYDSRNLFDDSEDEDGENSSMVFREDKCTEKRIADALSQQFPNWLEKLLQGMLPRVKLDSWPRMECDK